MPRYIIEGKNSSGNEMRACVEADNPQQAELKIRKEGCVPTYVRLLSSSVNTLGNFSPHTTSDMQETSFPTTIAIGLAILIFGIAIGLIIRFST